LKNEVLLSKRSTNCLFDVICTPDDYIDSGCPFVLTTKRVKKSDIPTNCSTWNKFSESRKERRVRYAEEAKYRREIQRSGSKDGATEAGA